MSQESMKKADIIVLIVGGVVQSVDKPKEHTMVIRDYDVDEDAPNHPDCRQDEVGDWFSEWFLPADSEGAVTD